MDQKEIVEIKNTNDKLTMSLMASDDRAQLKKESVSLKLAQLKLRELKWREKGKNAMCP